MEREIPVVAYLNGSQIPDEQLAISVYDTGFVQGVTVSEQLRTFGGKLFRTTEHFDRLRRSLQIVGIENVDVAALAVEAERLVACNYKCLKAGDDLGLTIFVTPGEPSSDASGSSPTVGMYTRPLPFGRWSDKYSQGESLVVSQFRQVPGNCWSPELKCRSRMHYFLADREAQQRIPGARAILLDQEGFVAEASTASVLIYNSAEGLVAPPTEKVLPSVSVGMLRFLCAELGVSVIYRNITPDELMDADEVILSSTSPCVLPVAAVEGRSVRGGSSGEFFTALIKAWSEAVELDIVAQATKFARR